MLGNGGLLAMIDGATSTRTVVRVAMAGVTGPGSSPRRDPRSVALLHRLLRPVVTRRVIAIRGSVVHHARRVDPRVSTFTTG